MHVIFRESHGLEETAVPRDLSQDPADLVVLSLSDSDLGAFAAGWHRGKVAGGLPSLRLANLADLMHPLSVDTYLDQTLSQAKAILIRLIGGQSYWSYGLAQTERLARRHGIALAVLPADGRPDPRLSAVSTLPEPVLAKLAAFCDEGGAAAAEAALVELALAAGLPASPPGMAEPLPPFGLWSPKGQPGASDAPLAALVFYRSYLVAADLEPIEALAAALVAKGFRVSGLYASSLKDPQARDWLAQQMAENRPAVIVNATAFSGRSEQGRSPLDVAGVPVFQIALATSSRDLWASSERGLSPSDLAMHVVLPEVDGRIFAGVASFKDPESRDPDLQYARPAHRAEPDRIAAIAGRIAGWHDLALRAPAERRVALVLSTYPGRGWNMAHAVGLDALASAEAMLDDLQGAGYTISTGDPIDTTLAHHRIRWPLSAYREALRSLPAALQDDLRAVWGEAEDDPDCDGAGFSFAAARRGNALIALQPERGSRSDRDAEYHDLSRAPRHSYVAFYLWLRSEVGALVHIGAHGTLEWLPGKSVALSATCWPEALIGDLPVIYPFIVNDPGEAAQAKRRIGAVTIGHIPPPLKASGTPQRLARLEALLDEFSNADGLDPRRRDRLQQDIRDEAQALGVEADLGLEATACPTEAITRIDRFVCDIKDSQFGDGLHIWGHPPVAQGSFDSASSTASERQALLDALEGRFIEPGPSGSPYRGRSDVLPTGRNLFTTDPRAVPSRAAFRQGEALAAELIRLHLQEAGDWPRALIVDLWGSATMRTAGEEFAMALALMGVRPVWDEGSERVSGIEILPIAELDRPRVDVTLRVSGLFRDVFPTLASLFQQAVRALSARDEAADWNPYRGAELPRVYGPAPGDFGLGMGAALTDYSDEGRRLAGEAWLKASAWTLGGEAAQADEAGLRDRVASADAFVHLQDLPETDLLLAEDYASHEAGFAAAQSVAGGEAQLYHLDTTDPTRPRARKLSEEVARVVRARASNPDWIAGMRRHGFRGAAEIAATLDNLAAFAHLAGIVPAHLFDLYWQATLGQPEIAEFLETANPGAYEAMRSRFAALQEAGLWQARRNSTPASAEALT